MGSSAWFIPLGSLPCNAKREGFEQLVLILDQTWHVPCSEAVAASLLQVAALRGNAARNLSHAHPLHWNSGRKLTLITKCGSSPNLGHATGLGQTGWHHCLRAGSRSGAGPRRALLWAGSRRWPGSGLPVRPGAPPARRAIGRSSLCAQQADPGERAGQKINLQ